MERRAVVSITNQAQSEGWNKKLVFSSDELKLRLLCCNYHYIHLNHIFYSDVYAKCFKPSLAVNMEYPTTFPDGCDDPQHNYNLTLYIAFAYSWMFSRSEIRILTIGLPIALVTGVLGNGVFLFVVARVKRLHNITNFYLANLAVADISFVISSAGASIYSYLDSPVRHDIPFQSSFGCVLAFGIPTVMYNVSLGIITLVTLERYYFICYPLQHMAISSKSRTMKLTAGTWIVGIALCGIRILNFAKLYRYCTIWPHLPDFIGWPQKTEFCFVVDENISVSIVSNLSDITPFFVALFWNGYMYCRIIYSLSHREIVANGERGGSDNNQNQSQIQAAKITKQVARMLIINGVVFFVCQIFTRVYLFDDILKDVIDIEKGPIEDTILVLGRCMLYVNSAINPLVYLLTCESYRTAFKHAFSSLWSVVEEKRDIETVSKRKACSTSNDMNSKL